MEAAGKRYIVYPSTKDVFSIWNLADIHYGKRSVNKSRLAEDIARIKDDPHAFWFGGGDYADYVAPNDKRWSAGEIDPEITVKDLARIGHFQCERVRDMFEPIKHKCMGLLLGNHEAKYMSIQQQTQLHGWLCTELGVENLGYCAMVDVVFRRKCTLKRPMLMRHYPGDETRDGYTVRFLLHHGFGGATTPGGKLNSLIKAMQMFDADVYMMGHVHDQKGQRQVRITADGECKKLLHKETLGVITGTYAMTYAQGCTDYGEVKGYAPTPIGAVSVKVNPSKREIRGEV